MDYKKNIKEYYSAIVDKGCTAEVPYSPEKELLEIKKKAAVRKQQKLRSCIAAAAVIIAVIGVSSGGFKDNKPVKIAKNDIPKQSQETLPVVSEPKSKSQTIQDDALTVDVADVSAVKNEPVQKQNIPQYTHVPQITLPPMEKIEYDTEASYTAPIEKGESYELGVYYALASTPLPEIDINESESIPAGYAMKASNGEGSKDSGELWSEEEYFEYLGKNPLEGLELPSDLIKTEPEEKYMLRNENGEIINDSRTFSYTNEDRTRLLNITTSKKPISDTAYESTDIDGVKIGVFDNHLSNTALLEAENLYISAEMYGLEEEELMGIVYSLAERMAL